MKEVKLINYFVLGQMADVVVTYTALHALKGFQEVGPLGSQTITQDDERLLIAKIGVAAFMVGLYALSRHTKLEYVSRKGLEISTVILYIVLTANAAQVLHFFLDQIVA